MSGRVFISYVREDSVRVDWLAKVLRENGVEIFLDRDNIAVGKDFDIEVANEIANGLKFISVFSRARAAREIGYINEETSLAIDQLKLRPQNSGWFLPVLIDGIDLDEIADIKIGGGRTLKSINFANLADYPSGVRSLLKALGVESPNINIQKPIAIGYKDYHEIINGSISIEEGLQSGKDGIRFGVLGGVIKRSEKNLILCLRLSAPFISYFSERSDLSEYILKCEDDYISAESANASIFRQCRAEVVLAGTKAPDGSGGTLNITSDVKANFDVTAHMVLAGKTISGKFCAKALIDGHFIASLSGSVILDVKL